MLFMLLHFLIFIENLQFPVSGKALVLSLHYLMKKSQVQVKHVCGLIKCFPYLALYGVAVSCRCHSLTANVLHHITSFIIIHSNT